MRAAATLGAIRRWRWTLRNNELPTLTDAAHNDFRWNKLHQDWDIYLLKARDDHSLMPDWARPMDGVDVSWAVFVATLLALYHEENNDGHSMALTLYHERGAAP